jgi:hypothetical protein
MEETNILNLSCRHCRYYQPEGRRGGLCQQLGVSVDSKWKACTLASFPFENVFPDLDTTLTTLEEIVYLETALSLSYKSYKNNSTQSLKKGNKNNLTAK